MSTIEEELTETIEEARRDELRGELRQLNADAWDAYAAAVMRREPTRVRERAFDVAMNAMRAVADVEGDRPWPVRTVRGGH